MMRKKMQKISKFKNTLTIKLAAISTFNQFNAPQNYPMSINQHQKNEKYHLSVRLKKRVSNDKLTLITRRDRTRKMWSFENVTFNE